MMLSKARLENAGKNWLATPSSKSGHGCQLCLSRSDIISSVSRKLDSKTLPDLIGFRYLTGSFDGSVALVCIEQASDPTLRKKLNNIILGEYRYAFVRECDFGKKLLERIPDNWGVIVCKRDTRFKVVRGAVDERHIGFNASLFDFFRHSFDIHDEEAVLLSFISKQAYHAQADTFSEMKSTILELEEHIAKLKGERAELRKKIREIKTHQVTKDWEIDVPTFLNS